MSSTEEEIKLLEKKLELLRQIKELESKINQAPSQSDSTPSQKVEPTGPTPEMKREAEIKESLNKLSEAEKIKLFFKRKDLIGPFRGSEREEVTVVQE